MVPIPPIIIPRLPGFAKPHMAYVMINILLGLRAPLARLLISI
jgi:hypothetical protein